jgi:prepilin-type N-terminal cleavage/methylation domain-containing protein
MSDRYDISARGGRSPGGFTIIEILVVLFIVAIMAGLAAPIVGEMMRSSALRAGTSQIATAIRRTRNMAIMSGKVYCFRFIPRPSLDDQQEVGMYLAAGPISGAITPPFWPEDRIAAGGDPAVVENEPPIHVGSVGLPRQVEVAFDLTQQCLMFLPDGSAWREGMLPPLQITVMLSEDVTGSDTPSDFATRERQIISIGCLTGRIAVSDRKEE